MVHSSATTIIISPLPSCKIDDSYEDFLHARLKIAECPSSLLKTILLFLLTNACSVIIHLACSSLSTPTVTEYVFVDLLEHFSKNAKLLTKIFSTDTSLFLTSLVR